MHMTKKDFMRDFGGLLSQKVTIVTPEPLRPDVYAKLAKLNIRVVDACLEEAIPIIKGLIDSGTEIFISRGGTADIIRNHTDLPVLNAEITSFDVLCSMCDTKSLWKGEPEIGLVTYHKTSHNIQAMEHILNARIHQFTYKNGKDIINNVRIAKKLGLHTLFGGIVTCRACQENGMRGILLRTNMETIFNALQKAEEVLSIREKDREINLFLHTILDLTDKGVVVLDQNGKVSLCNKKAELILKAESSLMGQNITDIVPSSMMRKIYLGQEVSEELVKTPNTEIILNSRKLYLNSINVGSLITFDDLSEMQQKERNVRRKLHEKGFVTHYHFGDIITRSESMKEIIELAKQFSNSDANILITGESGVGKELFAHSIHEASGRKAGPFVAINCLSLPDELLKSELFGYEEGAFTGAIRGGKQGLFEIAHNGTLFMDEIGEIPSHLQASLLRVLQHREVRRIGGDRLIPVNVRIIAATNRPLEQLVKEGTFRIDLYFRLKILELKIPPLRERMEDIPLLADNILDRMRKKYAKFVPKLSKNMLRQMQLYNWPGNIRELENFIESYVVLFGLFEPKRTEEILSSMLGSQAPDKSKENTVKIAVKIGDLKEMERHLILALQRQINDKNELARILGISRVTLWRKLRENSV